MPYCLKPLMPLKKSEAMETKIIHTIKEWIPWAMEGKSPNTEYELLRNLANYCRSNLLEQHPDKAVEIIRIINVIYSGGSRHERNAIENEFLEILATDESPASLKEHFKILPEKLRKAYLKIILEN
jgi:hypothetical protein